MKKLIICFLLCASGIVRAQCVTAGGTYSANVTDKINAGQVFADSLHYTRVCNEVFVSGRVVVIGGMSLTAYSNVQISIPIPSNLSQPPYNTFGQVTVHEPGIQQPSNGSVFGNSLGIINIRWKPQATSGANLDFYFSYSIH